MWATAGDAPNDGGQYSTRMGTLQRHTNAQPHSPATAPIQRGDDPSLLSPARLRSGVRRPWQIRLQRSQPLVLGTVSALTAGVVGVSLATGGAYASPMLLVAALLYPSAVVAVMLGSRALARPRPRLWTEVLRRTGQLPLDAYEEDARSALQRTGGTDAVVLLRILRGNHLVLTRLDLVPAGNEPAGSWFRTAATVADEAASEVPEPRHGEGSLSASETLTLRAWLERVDERPPTNLDHRLHVPTRLSLEASVLRRDRAHIIRARVNAPLYAPDLPEHAILDLLRIVEDAGERRRVLCPGGDWVV